MRVVRRVRWLRVSLVGSLAVVGLLSLRLWQWTDYAERRVERAEEEQRVERAQLEGEIDRLNRELKDARLLVHGRNPDEIVRFEYLDRALLRPASERLEQLLSQESLSPTETRPMTQEELERLAEERARSR